MKQKLKRKYLLPILLVLLSGSLYAQEPIIDLNIQGETTLENIISKIEGQYDYRFSYQQEDIQGTWFTRLPTPGKINVYLENLLRGTLLDFEILDSNFIVLKKMEVPVDDRPLYKFCGKVMDNLTNEPLRFTNVYLHKSNKGIATDIDGNFSFNAKIEEGDSLVVSYIGYKTKHFLAIDYSKQECPDIKLITKNYFPNIVISEYLTHGIQLTNNGASTQLKPRQIGSLPGQSEPEVLSTIQFLPGINSADGTASGLNVRGGTTDQNLILWEDIPVYHAAHYFGMLSAINPYIIDEVDVYRGGFGAEYGGRISSVIDLKSPDFANGGKRFNAGTNLIGLFTNGQFQTAQNKLSVVYSLRRSMTELWRSPAFKNITSRVHQGILVQNVDLNRLPPGIDIEDDFQYFDSNIKVNYLLSKKDKLSASIIYATTDFEDLIHDDMVRQTQADTLTLENIGANIAWNHQWNRKLSTRVSAVYTDYQYDYGYSLRTEGENRPDKNGQKKSAIKEQQLKLVNNYKTDGGGQFHLGYELINYDVGFSVSRTSRNNPTRVEKEEVKSNLHVLYGKYKSSQDKKVGVDLGLRYNYFQIKKDHCLEPRFRLWYNPNKSISLSFNGGKYYQFLSQVLEIEGDQSSIQTPVWLLAGRPEVPVLTATQFQVGVVYKKNKWLLDIQAYTKKINSITSLASDFDEDLGGNGYNIGEANIQGLDVLLKKRFGKFRSWLSYSISKVEYKFPTFFDKEFLAPHDQRHVFNWANMWSHKKFEFSLGWKLSSGTPYSLLENYEVKLNPPNTMGPKEFINPLVKSFNSERLPFQHQLDASILYNFQPRSSHKWKGVIGLSLFNIYHNKNLLSRNFNIKNSPNQPATLEYTNRANMGFTPNFVLRFEW